MAIEAPIHDRPPISLITDGLKPYGASLYIGGADGARDLDLLARHNITTVVNCAVNLDINYVTEPDDPAEGRRCAAGIGAIRYYKLGLIDDAGNPETMMLAGYYLLLGALHQDMPSRASYVRREKGNILVHCRGGRSRSVALVVLFLHLQQPERFPTLEAAQAHIRRNRELQPDEWFETPKPVLYRAAERSAQWIRQIEAADRLAATG